MGPAAHRLVARYKGAFVHPTEEDRKRYLKKHPNADPANHTVKEKTDNGPKQKDDEGGGAPGKAKPEVPEKGKPEEKHEDGGGAGAGKQDHGGEGHEAPEHGEEHEEGGEGAPKEKGGLFKRLSQKAKAFLSHASASVQKFVADEEHRAKVLTDAGKAVMASPKTYAKRLVSTAKHEVHEFKEAGEALAHLAKGKKLDHHQKKALKTVAVHMGIAVTAAALTSTGVLAGVAALGKGMAQKIALKAAARSLEKVHLVQELTHIGHGAHELMHFFASEDEGEDKKVEGVDPEEAFAILVMQSVMKELEEFSDDDMAEALEGAAGEQEKQAWKVTASIEDDLIPRLMDGAQIAATASAWIKRFNAVLVAARAESENPNRVWQDRFVKYFREMDSTLEDIRTLDETMDSIYLTEPELGDIASEAREALTIPRKAQIEFAISNIDFGDNPNTGKEGISYSVPVLREWSQEFAKWTIRAENAFKALGRQAARVLRSKGSV